MLTTLANIKANLGITDTTHDQRLTRQIARVSDRMARACGRVVGGIAALEYRTGLIETIRSDIARSTIWLTARPVVSISEVKEAYAGQFDDVDALTVDDDYWLVEATGQLNRLGKWYAHPYSVRVTYAGGYTPCDEWISGVANSAGDLVSYLGKVYYTAASPAADEAPDVNDDWTLRTGQVPLPGDLRMACELQVQYWWNRIEHNTLGITGVSAGDGNVTSYAKDQLLPEVMDVCSGYARKVGA
jgi:hypothetical protein